MKAGRMSTMEMAGGHGVKDPSGLQKMLNKAQELEDARIRGEAS